MAGPNAAALTTTSIGGAASFSDPVADSRTFLAINTDGIAGFSAATDSILELSGATGSLNQLQIF